MIFLKSHSPLYHTNLSVMTFSVLPAILVNPNVAGDVSFSGHLVSFTRIHFPSNCSMYPPEKNYKEFDLKPSTMSYGIHLLQIESTPFLLMFWLLTSPSHQQPWYWLCEIRHICDFKKEGFQLPVPIVENKSTILCFLKTIQHINGENCKYIFSCNMLTSYFLN